jgi:hypothetical protein
MNTIPPRKRGRPRTGSQWLKKSTGQRVIAVTTDKPGAKKERWTKVCPPGYSEIDARKAAQDLQREYDRGTWDPWVEAPPAPAADEAAQRVTLGAYVLAWLGKQTYESAPKERRALERYLGACPVAQVPVRELRPKHGAQLIEYLKGLASEKGGLLGHSPIRSAFNACARALDRAIVDELLESNPLRAKAVVDLLPAKADKVPGARAGWRFPLASVAALTLDARLLPDRRVLNALVFWTGMRPGEFRALRVRDVELDLRPLGKLTIARAIKSVSRAEGETKTGAIKEVPVVAPLAAVLRGWLATGWAALMGRAPGPDDLVLPSVRGRCKGAPRNDAAANRAFKDDQDALGLAPAKHLYVARHTLVRMLRDAGASRDIVRWATHAPPKSVYDGYADAPPWEVLCGEFGKLAGWVAAQISATVSATAPATDEQKPSDSEGQAAEAQRNRSSAGVSRGVASFNEDAALASSGLDVGRLLATLAATFATNSATAVAANESAPPDPLRQAEAALWLWGDRMLAQDAGVSSWN